MILSRSGFVTRLSVARAWIRGLRAYADGYLRRHTTRASICDLLEVAGVEPVGGLIFKKEKVALLLKQTAPVQLSKAWELWKAGR